MSAFKGTPGPWLAQGDMVSAHHAAGDPRVEYWICEEVNGDRRAGATEGRPSDNARLIAAAPDLLEALQDALCALECCGKDFPAATKASAAIAKVLGEQP